MRTLLSNWRCNKSKILHLNEQKEQLAQRQTEVQEQINQLDTDIARYEQQSQQWHQYQPSVSYLRTIFPDGDLTPQRCEQLILDHALNIKSLRQVVIDYETEIKQCQGRRDKLSGREAGSLEYLQTLAADVSGTRRWPKGERLIAEALDVAPENIWPSRYR